MLTEPLLVRDTPSALPPPPAPIPGHTVLGAPPAIGGAWPRHRLIAVGLTLTLAAALASPLAQSGRAPSLLQVAAIAVGVAVARFVRWRVLATGAAGAARTLGATIAPALAAAPLAPLATALQGQRPDLTAAVLTVPLTAAVLAAALAARDAELHYRASTRRLFFVGGSEQYYELAYEAQARSGEIVLVGHAFDANELEDSVVRSRANMLVLAESAISDPAIVAVASRLNLRGVRVRDLRGFYEQTFGKVAVTDLTPAWFLFDIAEIHRPRVYGTLKRTIEVAVSAVVLALALPLFPLIAAAIRVSSNGPIFFRQQRIGKGGHPFHVTKFRTMHTANGLEHGVWATHSEHRLFRVGRLLRKFRIDELPQLWHVLRGDMSLIGPRPEQPSIVDRLQDTMQFYGTRHSVRPGLTGWAQVNFGYGGTDAAALTKLQYDLFYIKRQGLRIDLQILAATIRTIFGGDGN